MSEAGVQRFELRVLTGAHAGARAELEGDQYTIGSADGCDFILSDEGVQALQARMTRHPDAWRVEVGEKTFELVSGRAVAVGPVMVTVEDISKAWPTLENVLLAREVTPAPMVEAPATAQPEVLAEAEPEAASTGLLGRRTVTLVAAAAATFVVAGLTFVSWPARSDGSQQHTEAITEPTLAQKAALEATLKELGLGGKALIDRSDTGWVVKVPVLTETQAEALSAAMGRMDPRPSLRMTTEHDLRYEVVDYLLRTAPEYQGRVTVNYLGGGRFQVEGQLATTRERDMILRNLATAFPQVREWVDGIALEGRSGDRLLKALRSNAWTVDGRWDGNVFEMDVRLARGDVGRWEQSLLAASQTHALPFRATLHFSAETARVRTKTDERLPFQVSGVVGGGAPFLMLSNGEKLAQGAVHEGWRLAEISGTRVVFESGSRRAILSRE